jgi:hypothetical protein
MVKNPGTARLYLDHPLAPAESKAPEPDETSLGHRRADHPFCESVLSSKP